MSDASIIARQSIALLADAAAKAWVDRSRTNSLAPKPSNPYDRNSEPEHHKQWACDFERFLLAHSVPDAEGSA